MASAPGIYNAAVRLRQGGKADVREALLALRERTLAIAGAYEEALGPAMVVRYDPWLNPPCWELGHLAWFQEWWVARNQQRARGIGCDPDHLRPPPSLDNADAWFDSSRVAHRIRWALPLPPLPGLRDWLDATLQQTLSILDALPEHAGDDELYFFRLAALHEAMHAEAASYMARTLGFQVPGDPPCAVGAVHEIAVPATCWRLGAAGPGFAFDNELPGCDMDLAAFRIDAVPVSWDRWQQFVQAGGYAQRHWWSEDGWRFAQQVRGPEPSFPSGEAAAMHLSWHEAQAWCRWAGRRLPTEAEWECAALTQPGFEWGQAWEWTASSFEGFAGFRPHPYRDYSQPWFGTRKVLRGACPATSPWLAHPRYRNFFEPQRHDVFAGLRSCAA